MAFPISFSRALLQKFHITVFSELARRMRTKSYLRKLHSKDSYYTNVNDWLKEQLNSKVAKKVVEENGWDKLEGFDDYKMGEILKWVKRNITYTSDKKLYGQIEYWATVDETLHNLRADCEDGSVLIVILAALSGVDMRKVYLVWGQVIGGGHAYVVYFRDFDGVDVVLDWCYWYTSLIVKFRKWLGLDKHYLEVWGKAWIN